MAEMLVLCSGVPNTEIIVTGGATGKIRFVFEHANSKIQRNNVVYGINGFLKAYCDSASIADCALVTCNAMYLLLSLQKLICLKMKSLRKLFSGDNWMFFAEKKPIWKGVTNASIAIARFYIFFVQTISTIG